MKELFADEAFVASLVDLETPEEVQAAVNAKGGELTLEEAKAIGEAIEQAAGGELSDADLDKVAGGFQPLQCKLLRLNVL
jgi:hypothetical protein